MSSCYELIEAEKTGGFPVQSMCRMLGVSRSGYYDWRGRPPSARSREDGALTQRIHEKLMSNLEFPTRQAAKTAIFDYLETFYNTRRLHSSLGYMSPSDFEEDRIEENRVA